MPPKRPSRPARGLTYADAGIDLDRYDAFTATIGSLVRRTHGPRVIQNPGGFAGLFRLDFNEKLFARNYRDPVLVACTDGVGTKIRIAQDLGIYDTIGIDLVAMNVNDLIVQGAEPLIFLDYLAVNAVDHDKLTAILKGIAEGCRISGSALIGGETAEMGDLYQPGDFDLAGFSLGVVELARATDPLRVQRGDVVLALASSGVHSNGYSLVRKIVSSARLDLAKSYPGLHRTLGEELLEPTRIYAESIVRLQRAYRVKKVISAMAHITGGGLAQNLERSLPPTVDAVLEPGSWPVPPIFDFLQRKGRVADSEMARVFNMGVGYCLVVRPTFAESVTRKLERLGERVYTIGRITKGTGKVRMKGA
ncbi:MAG: phosphoribosylformylglycinamidine cyclo-ligase [Phycisphaerales bacterium JB037]